ncbi:hypothetical protein ABZ883_14780 [Streptomyces sp. NPDC046977]|uniref:hypothetical protein n=1 Tax=Streptomyces sp. NPDC046977 TaxID=3154703 RepID=UPI00340D6A9E
MTENTEPEYLARVRQAWANTDDSGERLAELDMDPHRFKAIIDGQQRATSLDLAVMASAFRVTVDWLLAGERPRFGLPWESGVQHRFTACPVSADEERAATERARQAAAEGEKATAWSRDSTTERYAYDLHQALGLPAHDGVPHQGHPSAEAWWTELLATARALATRPTPAARADWAEDLDDWGDRDTCRVIDVDGEPIRLHGASALTEDGIAAVGQVIAAARRHADAHPPVVPDDDGTESALTRRIRAQQRGAIVAPDVPD